MGLIKKYSSVVSTKPFLVILFCLFLTILFVYGATLVKTETMEYKNMLPQGIDETKAINFIGSEFSSSGNQMVFVIELDSQEINSTEPRDIRDYQIAMYLNELGEKINKNKNVLSVSSYSTLIKNYSSNYLPKSNNEIIEIITNPNFENNFKSYITPDHSMTLLRVYLTEVNESDKEELIEDLDNILEETKKPVGIKVNYTGDIKISNEIMNLIGPTMASTSSISIIAILLIVSLLFFSLKKGLISLLAIIFGTTWVFGAVGFINLGINPAMSAAISMIMGIGIDFGIQIVNRFTQEKKINNIEESMKNTLENTLPPMFITTLAALIGFRAMSLGQLTLLGDLSTMMSLGIFFCFLAAALIIPPILVINERIIENKKNNNKPNNQTTTNTKKVNQPKKVEFKQKK